MMVNTSVLVGYHSSLAGRIEYTFTRIASKAVEFLQVSICCKIPIEYDTPPNS